MPSVSDYIRLRQIGSAQQEFGRMLSDQGSEVEELSNMAVNKSMKDEEDMPMDDEKTKRKKRLKGIIIKVGKGE